MSKGGCCHHFDPIYLEKSYGENIRQLYGICANCKRVVRAETLIRWLNIYAKVCEEKGIKVKVEILEGE